MLLFNRNLVKSTGRGPSQAVRNSRDRQEQIRIAEDFTNILDDEEAVILEAQQGEKPASFIPKCNSKHRPPTSSNAYDVQG